MKEMTRQVGVQMRFGVAAIFIVSLIVAVGAASGQGAKAAKPTDATVEPIKLTAEEQAERESRKACKIELCAAMRLRKPGSDVACTVVKSWRKSQLNKIVKKTRASWPWGKVRCVADISIKRELLIKAMMEPQFEVTLEPHQVACTVKRKKDTADIKFSFAPKIKFKGGKAVKASLNWGSIEAPTLVKGLIWTATKTDNMFNVLQKTIVEDINDFVSTRCDEIKSDWQNK